MQLAFWNFPPVECIETAAQSIGVQVEKQSASSCVDLLNREQVDFALLPVTTALAAADELDILPGGAISSWEYPFAWIQRHESFQQIQTLKSIPGRILEEFMIRVILKEHYGQKIRIVSDQDADIELHLETDIPNHANGPGILDLGQEWYELAQYPMVWGVYCCLRERVNDEMTQLLIKLTEEAELVAQSWGARSSSAKDQFFGQSLRFRLDDVAIAGLTAIRDYMYYYGLTKDPAPLSISNIEDAQQVPWWG